MEFEGEGGREREGGKEGRRKGGRGRYRNWKTIQCQLTSIHTISQYIAIQHEGI